MQMACKKFWPVKVKRSPSGRIIQKYRPLSFEIIQNYAVSEKLNKFQAFSTLQSFSKASTVLQNFSSLSSCENATVECKKSLSSTEIN